MTARNVKGVAHVEVVVVKEVIEFPELIDKLVERKISEMARSSAPTTESLGNGIPLPKHGRISSRVVESISGPMGCASRV